VCSVRGGGARRDGIGAARAPRVAADEASGGEGGSLEGSVERERLDGVVGAGRGEAASAARAAERVEGGGEDRLVAADARRA